MKRLGFALAVLMLMNCKKDAYKSYVGSYTVSGTDSYWLPNRGTTTDTVSNDTIIISETNGILCISLAPLYLNQSFMTQNASPCSASNCFAGHHGLNQCYTYVSYMVTFPQTNGDSILANVSLSGCGLGGGFTIYYSLAGTKF